jgi:hypothetical protein
MQDRLARDSAASGLRSVVRLALFAGVPLIGALALSTPALAVCGSHPAGVHSTATRTGVQTATSRPSSGGGGGGGGTLGCANGASAPTLRGAGVSHGLSMASSGRVVEGGAAHSAAHTATPARTAATKATHPTTAHLRGVKSPRA